MQKELASLSQIISYEIICSLGNRRDWFQEVWKPFTDYKAQAVPKLIVHQIPLLPHALGWNDCSVYDSTNNHQKKQQFCPLILVT